MNFCERCRRAHNGVHICRHCKEEVLAKDAERCAEAASVVTLAFGIVAAGLFAAYFVTLL